VSAVNRAARDAVLQRLRAYPSYRAWGRGVGLTLLGGQGAVLVQVQRPEHTALARWWVGDRSFGIPILVEAVGDFHALGDASVWPSDLLAYRQQWEPFIAAHLALWRDVNAALESIPEAKQCPAGLFTAEQVQSFSPAMRSFCASLALSRIRTSDTSPDGILPQWNAWAGRSSAEILAGAAAMLKWHQSVVLSVGGPYKDELAQIVKTFPGLGPLDLPPVPSFSAQQSLIAHIEGAYVATGGILQVIGYGFGKTLVGAANTSLAIAEGLRDTAKAIPKIVASPWTWIGVAAVATIVGGVLLVRYLPPSPQPRSIR
jgi:hypothetical protein